MQSKRNPVEKLFPFKTLTGVYQGTEELRTKQKRTVHKLLVPQRRGRGEYVAKILLEKSQSKKLTKEMIGKTITIKNRPFRVEVLDEKKQ